MQVAGVARLAHKQISALSGGERQRVYIARALAGDPEVLILDEPANGLDPKGIIWMRELLRDFAGRGGTVLLSSHLLHEVDAIADRLILINRGRVVRQGSKAELLSGGGSHVRSSDEAALTAALDRAGLSHRAGTDGLIAAADGEAVGAAALAGGVALSELRPAQGGLEELFLSLTDDGPEAGS
jgi:ABC-2 type transport system ATP-binding protein